MLDFDRVQGEGNTFSCWNRYPWCRGISETLFWLSGYWHTQYIQRQFYFSTIANLTISLPLQNLGILLVQGKTEGLSDLKSNMKIFLAFEIPMSNILTVSEESVLPTTNDL